MSRIQAYTRFTFRYQISIVELGHEDGVYSGSTTGGSTPSVEGSQGNIANPSVYSPEKKCPICGNRNCQSPHDDCDDVKRNYKTNTTQNYDLLSGMPKGPYTHNPSFEDFRSAVQKDNLEHSTYLNCVKENGDTTYYLGNIETGSISKVPMYATSNTIADIHNHPKSGNAPPSGQDIIHTASNAKDYGQFQYSYIYAANGDVYCLSVADRKKAIKFYNTYHNDINTTNNLFNSNTELWKSWYKGEKKFKKFNPIQRMEYQIAYLLSYFDTGIKILKKEDGATSFKLLDIKQDKSKEYSIPIICQ